jgi:hypothetical protein
MTMVPILGNERGDVAKPENLVFRRTSSYGTMVFENTDDSKDAIVPTNLMVRGRSAQDHAMSGSGVVQQGRTTHFENACCIEESQGGLLSGVEESDVLPIGLRKNLLRKSFRERHGYDKMWGFIKKWMDGVVDQRQAHLRYFYDSPNVRKTLEDFAAEFEPVDHQIGAIVLFSGAPVGLEIMPSMQHWLEYWKLLIRGCYGAELVRLKMLGKIQPTTMSLPDIPDDSNPVQVKEILEHFTSCLKGDIFPLLDSIEVKDQEIIDQRGSLRTSLIHTVSGGGDLIVQSNEPVYLSLVL